MKVGSENDSGADLNQTGREVRDYARDAHYTRLGVFVGIGGLDFDDGISPDKQSQVGDFDKGGHKAKSPLLDGFDGREAPPPSKGDSTMVKVITAQLIP